MVTATSFLNLFAIVVPSSVFGGGVFEISGNRNSRWKESVGREAWWCCSTEADFLPGTLWIIPPIDESHQCGCMCVCVKIDTTFAICLAYFPAIFGVGYGRKGDGKCVLMVVECWHTRSQIQYPIFSYLTKTGVSTITPHVIYPFWFENVKSRLLKESRRILLRWNSSSIKQAYYYCKMKFQYCPEIDQTISNFYNRPFSSCPHQNLIEFKSSLFNTITTNIVNFLFLYLVVCVSIGLLLSEVFSRLNRKNSRAQK